MSKTSRLRITLACCMVLTFGMSACSEDEDTSRKCGNALCEADHVCQDGACVKLCGNAVCLEGQKCVDDQCVDKCGSAICGDNQKCVENKCVDLCGGEVCDNKQKCLENKCVDLCGTAICGDNQKCVNDKCIDLCGTKVCGDNQKCLNSECVEPCGSEFCHDNQKCVNDKCIDLCGAKVCGDNQKCLDSECVEPCGSEFCHDDQKCVNDKCQKLCGNEVCRSDQKCVNDQCLVSCAGVFCKTDEICNKATEKCVQDPCPGCEVECGHAIIIDGIGSCSLPFCLDAPDCASECDPMNLSPGGDFDGDGISNLMEISSGGFEDPCRADTDGDTIPDGLEDLNHNGVYEPALGETRPDDPASKPSEDQVVLMKQVCNADGLTGTSTYLENIVVAQLEGAAFADENAPKKKVTVFSDAKHKVVGFFGAFGDKTYTGMQLLRNSTVKDGYYVEASNFSNAVPMPVWLENKSEDGSPVYDKTHLQVMPDHTVNRYKYEITLEDGQTLENVRDAIAKVFDAKLDVGSAATSTSCSGGTAEEQGKAILYLARSGFTGGKQTIYAYSGALACRSTLTASKNADSDAMAAVNRLEDVISGTLVGPRGLPNGSYGLTPFRQFVCQIEKFGHAAGTVDFLWVIDNTGSMEDEQAHLTSTVKAFTERLDGAGIDYRLAVTTTDAYLLDETGTITGSKYSYDTTDSGVYTPLAIVDGELSNDLALSNQQAYKASYLNYLGIHTETQQLSCFIDKDSQQGVTAFIQNVAGKTGKPNIKGKAYEDGLKSGALTLERLGLTVNTDSDGIKPELLYTIKDTASFATLKRKTAYVSPRLYDQCSEDPGNATCSYRMPSCNLRDNALKYIIWVSDEESRQFKEDADAQGSLLSISESHLYGCRTGYKLEGSSMKTGKFGGDQEECNKPMLKELESAIDSGTLTADMSLEDIKRVLPQYGAMLEYYLEIYRRFAGKSDVTGFALVGDIGTKNGGACPTLKICKGRCLNKDGEEDTSANGQKGVGCFSCEGEYEDSEQAVVGANYGLSYIHMARFMSREKEGGSASICNTTYSRTIDSIFEDVAGRVASHPLKGYPIASTIRVAVKSGGKTKELTRGAASDGWSYDASQNAIVFSGANIKKDDYIAISYVLWKKNEG